MAIYTPPNFVIQELVPEHVFKVHPDPSRLWRIFDPRLLKALELLGAWAGPLYINTWHSESAQSAIGFFDESGLRDHICDHYSYFSRHTWAGAFDIKSLHYSPVEMLEFIQGNPDCASLVARIEDPEVTKTWFHIDNGNHGGDGIYVFRP